MHGTKKGVPMRCPQCQQDEQVVKNGKYIRKSDKKPIQSFLCKACKKRFSTQTFQIDYRHRKRHINQQAFRLLCQGVSQRTCAFLLGVRPNAIAIRIKRFGEICKQILRAIVTLAPKSLMHSWMS